VKLFLKAIIDGCIKTEHGDNIVLLSHPLLIQNTEKLFLFSFLLLIHSLCPLPAVYFPFIKVLQAVFDHCTAFLSDVTKTLLILLTEDRTVLQNTDTPQLRDQCLQVTNFTIRTKSTGNYDENTISLHVSSANSFFNSCLVMQ